MNTIRDDNLPGIITESVKIHKTILLEKPTELVIE